MQPLRRVCSGVPVAERPPRPTSQRHNKTNRWKEYAAAFIRRYPICLLCVCNGSINECGQRGLVVDHIEPHRGNRYLFWLTDNHQTLCKTCHDTVKQKHESDGKTGSQWTDYLRQRLLETHAADLMKSVAQCIPAHMMETLHAEETTKHGS